VPQLREVVAREERVGVVGAEGLRLPRGRWRCRSVSRAPPVYFIAPDVTVILTPPCTFHHWFFKQNIWCESDFNAYYFTSDSPYKTHMGGGG
jgi:hypothetical protein